METIVRNLLRYTAVCTVLLSSILPAGAQNDFTTIQEAFIKSYELENEGDYAGAINELKEIYDEGSYEINIRLGWLVYNAGLFSESSAYYQKSIGLVPLTIEARLGYALPESAMGNWEHVINTYNEILEIDPSNSLVHYKLGSIYYGKKDFETAFKYFEKVANYYPFDYDITIMYAWTNWQLGKLREAQVLFQKALIIRPGDESANEGLSLIK